MPNDHQQDALRQLLEPVLPGSPLPPAAGRPEMTAAAVCPACRQFVTWPELTLDRDGHHLACPACRAKAAAKADTRRRLAILTMPGFHVMLIGLLAAGLWVAGAGSPSPARLQRQDQRRDWQRQQYPRLLLQQARRARSRAEVLAAQGRQDQAGRWAALAEQAFRGAAAAWATTPAAPDLLAGAALMRAVRDEPGPAHGELTALAEHYGETDPSHRTYLYQRGRLALLAGRTAAGRADLELLLTTIQQQPADFLTVVSKLTGDEHRLQADPDTFKARQQTRLAAGLDIPDAALFEGALALLAQYHVPSAVAAAIEKQRKRPVSVPESGSDPGNLTIEEFK